MHTPGTSRKSTYKLREKHGHIGNTKKFSIHAKQNIPRPAPLFTFLEWSVPLGTLQETLSISDFQSIHY